MYSRSSSDYINLKHDHATKNTFTSRNSSSRTQVIKINTILMSCTTDLTGNIIPPDWYNIPITTEFTNISEFCPNAAIVDLSNNTELLGPLLQTTPLMSGEPYKSIQNPCNSYEAFQQNLKLCKRKMKKFPGMAFI